MVSKRRSLFDCPSAIDIDSMSLPSQEREQQKEDCVRQALISGAKASAFALTVSSLVVGLANQFLPTFRTSLGVSGKTALIVSIVLSSCDDMPNLSPPCTVRIIERDLR